ncbi:MAG: AsmA family protein [Gammaproteobacteria bacterium]|nr:AsmA family protein [Gammaproteobacteria bacterium]
MARLIKILAGIFGALILLLVLVALLLPLLFDQDDLKHAIGEAVLEETGRKLTIAGDLEFSVFPWLAVEVSQITLGNAAGFSAESFAEIGQASLGVRLMPLLKKKIEVGRVTLDDFSLKLSVKANGRNNWQDLLESGDVAAESDESGAVGFDNQGIAGLTIRNALIDYKDDSIGTHYTLSEFSLESGALGGKQPVPVEMTMRLEDRLAGQSAQVEMRAVIDANLPENRFSFTDLVVQAEIVAADLPGGSQRMSLKAPEINSDLDAQTLSANSFELSIMGLQLRGALAATSIIDNPAYSGQIWIDDFSPRELFTQLRIDIPETADPDVLTRARAEAKFKGNSQSLALSEIDMRMDQSQLSGKLSVRNFDRPTIDFELSMDQIEMDRYLEPVSETPGGVSLGETNIELPVDLLEGLDIGGQFTLGSVLSAGMTFTDMVAGVTVKNNRLRLYPVSALFYGGTYSGDIRLDGSADLPVLSINEKIEGIQFEKMAADLFDGAPLSGTADGHARLSGEGRTSGQVSRRLAGDIGLTINDGAWEGTNIWYEIRRALALFKMQAPPEPPAENRTVFSRMQATATVSEGVMTTNDLVAELPFISLSGGGTVDLASSEINLNLVAVVRSDPELLADGLTGDIAGKRIPLKITGTLDDPGVQPDFAVLLKEKAEEILLEKLGLGRLLGTEPDTPEDTADPENPDEQPKDPEDQLKDDIEEKIKDKLKDLFGGG